MLGAIAGDIIGSFYEHHPTKSVEFPLFHEHCRFTDDSVMTVAVAHAILENRDYGMWMKDFGRKYPNAGYGGSFFDWLFEPDIRPYNSWGNGSAMRVSPVGFAFDSADDVLIEAKRSAEVSHNHPEGIKGAQATALAIFLARKGGSKELIRNEITERFHYDLDRTIETIRPSYEFDISCQGTVPEAIIAFLESRDYEDAVRKAISLGGDSDPLACIAGSIADAYYKGVPTEITKRVREILPLDLLRVLDKFSEKYVC
jgi:ADP-ribosylglycohydrolase